MKTVTNSILVERNFVQILKFSIKKLAEQFYRKDAQKKIINVLKFILQIIRTSNVQMQLIYMDVFLFKLKVNFAILMEKIVWLKVLKLIEMFIVLM